MSKEVSVDEGVVTGFAFALQVAFETKQGVDVEETLTRLRYIADGATEVSNTLVEQAATISAECRELVQREVHNQHSDNKTLARTLLRYLQPLNISKAIDSPLQTQCHARSPTT